MGGESPVFHGRSASPWENVEALCGQVTDIDLSRMRTAQGAGREFYILKVCCLGVARGRRSSALSTAALKSKVRRRAPALPVRVYTMVSGQSAS